jgi:pentapeptide repeat protein
MEAERSFEELAGNVYPGLVGKDEQVTDESTGDQADGGVGSRSFEELADAAYPASSPRIAPVNDAGEVSSVIRDTDGNILHGSEGAEYSDIRDFVQYNSAQLANSDLHGIDFQELEFGGARMMDSDLRASEFHGNLAGSDLRGADLRGASFEGADLRRASMVGIQVDGDTNIAGVDFSGATMDEQTYRALRGCSGSDEAIGLKIPTRK